MDCSGIGIFCSMLWKAKLISDVVRLIGLCAFLLFLIFYVRPVFLHPAQTTVLKFYGLPTDTHIFSPAKYFKDLSKKHFLKLELTGDPVVDNKKMEIIKYEERKMKYTNDTRQVIVVQLGKELSYGKFVELLDMVKGDDHKKYFEWNNSFYILLDEQKKPEGSNTIQPLYL
jgi:hypothetical protein